MNNEKHTDIFVKFSKVIALCVFVETKLFVCHLGGSHKGETDVISFLKER